MDGTDNIAKIGALPDDNSCARILSTLMRGKSLTTSERASMELCGPASSFDELMDADLRLLDVSVMLSHYRREILFSEAARPSWVPAQF